MRRTEDKKSGKDTIFVLLVVFSILLAAAFMAVYAGYLQKCRRFTADRKAVTDACIRLIESGRREELTAELERLQNKYSPLEEYRSSLEALEKKEIQ